MNQQNEREELREKRREKKRKEQIIHLMLATFVVAVLVIGNLSTTFMETNAEGTDVSIATVTTEAELTSALANSYDTTVTLGDNVTLESGDLFQTVTSGSAITDIVISADSGYGFTNDYITSLSENGITVTRDGTNQMITISGTPTADYTRTISATEQVNAETPVFNADLVSATYDDGDTIAALDGTATTTDDGKITYQWYVQPYGGSWGNVVTGGTSAKYTPIISAGNQRTYCVYATNTIEDNGDGGKKTVAVLSNEAVINVDLDWPTFNTNLSTDEVVYYYTQTADTLEVSASVDDGEITYQWYKSTTGTSWTAISNQTGTTYTPVTTSAGTTYYKCIATNTYNSKTMYTHSNIATITVNEQVNAETPTFNAELEAATYEYGETVIALDGTATVTDGGTVTYQWYDDNGSIYNATGATYTPSSGNVAYDGTYYVIAKNTITNNGDGGTKTVTIESNHVKIEIVPTTPTFNTDLDETAVTYYYSETPSGLTVNASASLGSLTYQWYQKDADDSEFVAIEGETSASYTPDTTLVGTTQYKCVAIHTHSGEISTADSKVATITVNAQVNAQTPTFNDELEAATYEYGETVTALDGTATVTDGGTVTYQWYLVGTDAAINDATSATYTPSQYLLVGTHEYYVIATNTINDNGDGGSKTATTTSDTVTITVTPQTPTFTTDLSAAAVTYCYGDEFAGYLKVVASAGSSNLSYQWYTSANGTDWTILQGENTNEVGIRTTMVGTTYYKCVVTNTYDEYTATADSKVAMITVAADVPNISTDLSETVQKESYGTTATALTVSAKVQDGGTITYQWYSKTTGEWATISNATSASYTPPTNTLGTTYYKVEVTNTNGTSISTAESETATVTVEQKALSVVIDDKEIVRGMSIPTFTSIVSGNVDGDVITVSYSTTADNMTAADYAITMTNADDYANYDISVTTGTLTVKDGYTVSFDDTDVTDIAYGATVSQPADPTKEGYIFIGWYLGNSAFDFTTAITGDLEVTSVWEAVVEKEIETTGSAEVVIETEVEEQLLDELFTEKEIDLNVEMKVTIQVDVVAVEDIDEAAQAEFDTYLETYNQQLEETETVVQAVVFDISLIKSLAGVEENITNLATPIRITIEIPEEYQGDGRAFFILRNHDGEITILEDLDDDPTTITIETDRFSNYTLNYVETDEDVNTNLNADLGTDDDTDTADTGDSNAPLALMVLMFVSLLGIFVVSKRRLDK